MILAKCDFFHFLDLLADFDIGHVQRSRVSPIESRGLVIN